MSQENVAAVKTGTRRPIEDQIVLRMPFLVDLVLARLAHLPPGSSLRRRLFPWALQRGFDAVSRNDYAVPLLGYEPDAEIFISGAAGLGFAESYSGHQGWRDFVSDFFEDFPEPHFTVNRVLDAGDRWVADVEFLGQGRTSGAQVGNNWGTVYYLSPRGKIRRQDIFFQDGWKLVPRSRRTERVGRYCAAMSQENVELTYQAHDAFNRRDLHAFLAAMHPDTEFTPYEVAVQGGEPYRGRDGMRRWWEESLEVLPDLTVDLYEVREVGDRVFVRGRLHGHGAGSGAAIDRPLWGVLEFQDGKQFRYWAFGSEAEALEAAGLRE